MEKGTTNEALSVLNDFLIYIQATKNEQDLCKYAEFGFNGKLPEYFHENTFKEILSGRQYLKLHPCKSWSQAIVYSCFLHILHGNRPYALSRRSHPVTP